MTSERFTFDFTRIALMLIYRSGGLGVFLSIGMFCRILMGKGRF
ncbi:hypothetical protein [Helicobacter marmotae]|nr:hypothetical protein [Helicobacter marmotae]